MRRRVDDFDNDEDEEDDYMDGFPPSGDDGSEALDLSSSRSLDDLKNEGRDLHEDAPEGADASDLLSNPADAFVFGATDAVEDVHHEGEDDGEDDGITVDENGTEWWEDEDGTWWYREDGWEDWAVWEE